MFMVPAYLNGEKGKALVNDPVKVASQSINCSRRMMKLDRFKRHYTSGNLVALVQLLPRDILGIGIVQKGGTGKTRVNVKWLAAVDEYVPKVQYDGKYLAPIVYSDIIDKYRNRFIDYKLDV
jgi:hypothetical protein